MKAVVRKAFLGLTSAAMLTVGIVAVQSAHAGETVTVDPNDSDRISTLLKACNAKDPAYSCTWTNTSHKTVDGDAVIVGPDNGTKKFINCATSGFLRETLSWSRQRDSSWNVGVTVGTKTELEEIFASLEVSAAVTVDQGVTNSRTFTASTQIEVEGGHVGWVFHVPKNNVVSGTLNAAETGGEQINWVLPQVTLSGPHPTEGGTTGVGGDVQNDEEKALCASVGRPDGTDPDTLLVVDAGDRKP